jgi:hypothetical protein
MIAAVVIGPSMSLLGAAGGHIYQMIKAHNFQKYILNYGPIIGGGAGHLRFIALSLYLLKAFY